MPPLKATTGTPACTAFCATGPTASTCVRVTAIPSTLLSIAFCTSVACRVASGSLEYFSSTPVFLAACSAPARTLSQNVSPGASCVIIAMVND